MKVSIKEKLLSKSIPLTECGCLIWLGGLTYDGYGKIRIGEKITTTHRVSFREFIGEIPLNFHVLHRCDIRCCIEPSHLFLGDNLDNVIDKTLKLRTPHGYKHHKAKIDEAELIDVKNSDETLKTLASKYDMSISGIWNIKQGNRRIYNK